MMIALFAAFASDAEPAQFQPSAVPLALGQTHVQLRGYGGYAGLGPSDFSRRVLGVGLIGDVGLSKNLKLGAEARFEEEYGVGSLGILGPSASPDPSGKVGELNLRLTVPIQAGQWHLAPFVVAGTQLQLGFAAFWQHPRSGMSFDFAWGPTVRTEMLIKGRFSDTELFPELLQDGLVDAKTYLPEAGFTFPLDQRRRHSIRVGILSAMPVATYRVEVGPVHLEATAGTNLIGGYASAGVGTQF